MKTKSIFKKAFAMLVVAMVLVSCLATTAFAAEQTLTCPGTAGTTAAKLCESYPAGIKYSDTETDECKYATSIEVGGVQKTVYLNTKPTTSQIGVQMKDDGSLSIDGISSSDQSAWNQLFSRFKGVIVGLTGVGTMVMIVLFIIQFMKLGSSAGNPQQRSQALSGVLWTGIAAALLGSVTIIVGFFYNAI